MEDKLKKARFLQETFLLADMTAEIVLEISYLTLSNTDIHFADKDFLWSSYTTTEAMSTIKWVELINKKKFAKRGLDENVEAFIVHLTSLSLSLLKRCLIRTLKPF